MREGLNIRVGGEVIIRGGVARIRWRARARRGTVEEDESNDMDVGC